MFSHLIRTNQICWEVGEECNNLARLANVTELHVAPFSSAPPDAQRHGHGQVKGDFLLQCRNCRNAGIVRPSVILTRGGRKSRRNARLRNSRMSKPRKGETERG